MKEDGSSKGKQPSNCLDLGEFLKERWKRKSSTLKSNSYGNCIRKNFISLIFEKEENFMLNVSLC